MADAVIVAAARSPIGRAFKGSLKDLRSDDLTATIVRAALDQVPQLDPSDVDDLMLGCGLPGGEAGFNMARVVAVLLGYDHLPGTTLTRYCASSLQTTRMAMHAIKAGEGEVFLSAGVETVSRHVKGSSDSLPDTTNPLFADAGERTAATAQGGAQVLFGDGAVGEQVPLTAGQRIGIDVVIKDEIENLVRAIIQCLAEQVSSALALSAERPARQLAYAGIPAFAAAENSRRREPDPAKQHAQKRVHTDAP